jgi:hypothetical protein
MKTTFTLLLLLTLIYSCSAQERNPTVYVPEKMTEEELYYVYGLEATSDVYEFLDKKLRDNEEFKSICVEKTLSNFISVDISVEDNKIISARTRHSEYSPILDTLIINSFLDNVVEFEFIEGQNGHFDFRIDISKLCKGTDFSPTPPKDNTLETKPLLKEYLIKQKI